MNKQTIITILLALGTRFAFPFGQRPLVPGFAEGFSLNTATFSARLRIIYGIFRIFAP
jgi:hypothetical protein